MVNKRQKTDYTAAGELWRMMRGRDASVIHSSRSLEENKGLEKERYSSAIKINDFLVKCQAEWRVPTITGTAFT